MRYYIIAGETSGDQHASWLMKSIQQSDAAAEFRFWGGERMKEVAQKPPIVHCKDISFMGFWEVFKNLPQILRLFTKAKKDILSYKPDVLILVDYPGFNLRMAKWAHLSGIKTCYYIAPQVWAWKEKRVESLRKYVDELIVILHFELEYFKKRGIHAHYFGHPLQWELAQFNTDDHFLSQNNIKKPFIALVPGSRQSEITRMLPVMLHTVKEFDHYDKVITQAPGLDKSFYLQFLGSEKSNIHIISGRFYDVLGKCEAALVTSGTATLEAALLGAPQVVCYRSSGLSYAIAKRLVNVPFISLVNLICQREVVKELIQQDASTHKISEELKNILNIGRIGFREKYNELNILTGSDKDPKQMGAVLVNLASQSNYH
jgi:lipid-A-disaccharide synthase